MILIRLDDSEIFMPAFVTKDNEASVYEIFVDPLFKSTGTNKHAAEWDMWGRQQVTPDTVLFARSSQEYIFFEISFDSDVRKPKI